MRAGSTRGVALPTPSTSENIVSTGKLDDEIMTTGSAADELLKRDTKRGVFQRGSKKVHIRWG
jgi:hypothetical protein